ncbi:MAG: hypothetical protein AAFZ87_17545, partial [Planctomycetota bacterium]
AQGVEGGVQRGVALGAGLLPRLALAEQLVGGAQHCGGRLGQPGEVQRVEAGDGAWLGAGEWRCHFHVPIHAKRHTVAGGAALGTTVDHADAVLAAALARRDTWLDDELHVELETYTWGVLEGAEDRDLVDELEAEYGHVVSALGRAGFERA